MIWFMFHNSNSPVQSLTGVRWTLLQHIWSINCSAHKLWVSFCDLRIRPVGSFQRDFFVECILLRARANISSGILHEKCANKSHSKGCNFPWAERAERSRCKFSCPIVVEAIYLALSFTSWTLKLHLRNLSQRLLKLDVKCFKEEFSFIKRCKNLQYE